MSPDDTPDDGSAVDRSAAGSRLLPGFVDRSFLAKFVLSLVLVSLLIGGVSAYTYVETSSQLSEQARTEYTNVAEQSVTQIVEWREARSDTTRMLSQFEVVRNGNPDQVQQFLQSEANRLPSDVYRVHFVNLDNSTILASTNRAKQGETLNTREAPWQNEQLDYGPDGVYVSSAEEVHLRSMVSFVSPVDTGSDDRMVLVVQTDLDEVARGLRTPHESVFSQVVDSRGRIVAGTQEVDAIERNDGSLERYSESGANATVVQAGLAGGSGFLKQTAREPRLGGDYVATYAGVPNSDWVVVTHVPTARAFALRSTITDSLLVLVGTALLGFGLIAVAFGRGTVRALRRLTEKADELESGNLDVDLPVRRADEFGSLTASFASMRDALTDRIEEAEQARKEAEVSRAEAMELNEYLQNKADEYADIMQQCAAGDITQRMDIDGENEAMDHIGTEFNAMIQELEKTTGQLKSFADEVETAGREVEQSAEVVRETSEQAADAALEVSSKTEDQKDRLRTVADRIDEIAADLEAVDEAHDDLEFDESLDRIQEIATLIGDALTGSTAVMRAADEAATSAEEQAAELNEVSERAGDLVRYAGQLQDVLGRFETESEHEFYFPTGPGGDSASAAED